MIEMSDAALDVVQRSYILRCRVRSLLGDEVLADDVPVNAGTLEVDRSLAVPERLSLAVPRLVDGVDWSPGGDIAHPLAPWGQTLVLELGVDVGRGDTEWLARGEFLIRETSTDGDTVQVEAVGLLALIEEARFATVFQPSGTFQAVIRALVEPALTVEFDSSCPTNRTVAAGVMWEEERDDRLQSLQEVLNAWPAVATVDPSGVLVVRSAADSSTPVLTLTDGAGGTVVSWAGQASRDGAYSLVVARGQQSDGQEVQGVAYDLETASPTRYGGPFNPLPVPLFYFSPLLTTTAQCQAAAATILAKRKRSSGRMLVASAVPHPGVETGDLVTIENVDDVSAGIVEALTLPLTADGGAMSYTLRVVS